MNHMPEIAKMLGVEMGDKFKIKRYSGETGPYALDNNRLYYVGNKRSDPKMLQELLNGELEIVKLPFKPQKGEKYWVWRKDFYNAKNVFVAQWIFWCGDITDKMCYMLGNCYLTKQECLADTAMKERLENMERCEW